MALIKKFRIKSFKKLNSIIEFNNVTLAYGNRIILDYISFNATDKAGETVTIDKKYVQDNLGNLVKDTDLSKFIL